MGRKPPTTPAVGALDDPDGFARFYRRFEDPVLGYFLRRTRRPELAADLASETFAAAFAGRAGFDPQRGEPSAWLFGIARNVLAESARRGAVDDRARRRLGMERIELDDADLARIDALADQPARDAVDRLPTHQREAILGRFVAESDYDELAAALDCSPQVVRQHVSRGLRTLRSRLESPR